MIIYKEHLIELWVNGQKVELEDQKSINMRFNNVLFDPTKISSTQAEYSFEFEVPATPKNNIIFDYANNLGKLNKFHQRYKAEVYADGSVIFSGTITINSFKDKKYHLNLVSVKVYSLDDIFGEAVMSDIEGWKIDFDGVSSINQYNAASGDVMFPLVSYGAFQKSPYSSDDVANDYTSKFELDEYNRWYVESFYPSANMLGIVRKAFEWKGYSVAGDAFQNPKLNKIYMSTNLAEGQDPTYNVGNPNFGSINISTTFTSNANNAYQQELHFPYYGIAAIESNTTFQVQQEYNFKAVNIFDMLGSGSTVTVNQDVCYLYQPDESVIVIPADGFYKIELSASTVLNTLANFTAAQYTRYSQSEEELNEEDLTLTPNLNEITPVEIHLVRNYDDNVELIKGKHNTEYVDGNPNDTIAWGRYENQKNWETCYPHEDPYNSTLPSEKNDLSFRNTTSRFVGRNRTSGQRTRGSSFEGERSSSSSFDGERAWTYQDYGYIYNDGEIMAYDQAVSEAFICGLSSMKGGVAAVMKNGYSWSKSNATKNEAFYPEIGYSKLTRQEGSGNLVTEQTNFNYNTYINTPISYVSSDGNNLNGYVSCMVYLKKNDVLNLFAVQREYHTAVGNNVSYSTTSSVNLKISAASPRSYDELEADHFTYYTPTEFDTQLNIPNFFNKEKKISEWIQNVIDAYNLEFIQEGDTVTINTKKHFDNDILTAVDIDDRVNSSEAEAKVIDYPKSMAVKYKIDTEEWGAEKSVISKYGQDYMNRVDWKDFIDSGYTNIMLNDDSYVTSTSEKQLQFSYTWYDSFKWYSVNSSFKKTSNTYTTFTLPVISKFTYMVDGYSYDESMKHDGYGLTQRMWFTPVFTPFYVWTRTWPIEKVNIYIPTNNIYHIHLSYKDTERSILTNFFNINAYLASNYVEVDVYLTADEYNRIKNGALVHFDSDLYIPVEIQAFDPSGSNPSTLKLMKKIN